MSVLLAVDVGGTKTFLRAVDAESYQVLVDQRLVCADYPDLTSLMQAFLEQNQIKNIAIAVLGLAGPVEGRVSKLTNLPWQVDAAEIEQTCAIDQVYLINDFTAAALGVDELNDSDVLKLQAGNFDAKGNRLVIGAGTGLGVAPVKNCQGEFIPQDSEGGHIDFAPINEVQLELLAWLHQKWHHVSYERILSGEGLKALYKFFDQREHGIHHRMGIEPQDIQNLADQGNDVAQQTLETFVEVYGAYIGNAALIWEPKAGVYVAGGIAPKIQSWMMSSRFIEAFLDKGRMKSILQQVPIYLVVNEQLGLLGALALAKKHHKILKAA